MTKMEYISKILNEMGFFDDDDELVAVEEVEGMQKYTLKTKKGREIGCSADYDIISKLPD